MPYFIGSLSTKGTIHKSTVKPKASKALFKMVRVYIIVAMVCFLGLVSGQTYSPFLYPVQHRAELKPLQDEASAIGYDLQVSPSEQSQQAVVEYDPFDVSLLGLVWNYLPSPIIAIKSVFNAVVSKIWKIAKFLIPVELVLLGMGLVLGFCAFTPYCTLIIEEPIASNLRAIRSSIPYIDELEYYVNEAVYRVQELQG